MLSPGPKARKLKGARHTPRTMRIGLALAGLVTLLMAIWWKAPSLQHRWYRLTALPPEQAELVPSQRYAGVLFIGQSNAANHGTWRGTVDGAHRAYHDGRFHRVRDPLPGCSGVGGSVGTQLASQPPVDADAWLLACVAQGSTAIADWDPGKPLARAAAQAIDALVARGLGPHWIVVHQGETDAWNRTSPADYEARLRKLLTHLHERAPQARILLCRTTIHSKGAARDAGLRAAQERVWRSMPNVWAGVDTDSFPARLRARDGVHFNGEGLEVFAKLLRQAMTNPSDAAMLFDAGIAF